MIIRWATRSQRKSFLLEQLTEIEAEFAKHMGNISCELLDSSEYQVCKFPRSQFC